MNKHIVDVLIENIKKDQILLTTKEQQVLELKEERRSIVKRLKSYEKDVDVVLKYADDDKRKELEALGFHPTKEQGLNSVAERAFNLILEAKSNQLSNAEWYNAYVSSLAKKADAVNYTEFNIKCRSLFNTQRLLRKKGKDSRSSRDDVISLNGSVSHNLKTKIS